MVVNLPVIAYGGMCHVEFSMALARLYIEALKRGEVNFISNAICFESLISRGRNAAAASALHHNSDYLMFIDADVIFQPEDVFKLISHDKDVVCGVYPKKYVNDEKVNFLFSNCNSKRNVLFPTSFLSIKDSTTKSNLLFINSFSTNILDFISF